MNKSNILLLCIGLLSLGVAPVTQAQNARSSNITVIRDFNSDVTGRSYYNNRRSYYRNNSDYYRPSGGNVIININSDDCYRQDDPFRFYRRGGGQTINRDLNIQRVRSIPPSGVKRLY
ncbi:hypothetical protein C7H19_19075 [Aphanothece hegewaldii CCALA 016]|uniref:Uncharacterized protein n=1 Tax=Aphanothece hegewaldii CCALA 016 TaxID=2107694 RepID=A0A2T1LTJ5_9CHRO|nr:hypothetical protein [Aphanothece hegewaldii]PSF34233.1 hypothetical protein C7H19_19075 [Aphanothece hegewaldii CCALA 016]